MIWAKEKKQQRRWENRVVSVFLTPLLFLSYAKPRD